MRVLRQTHWPPRGGPLTTTVTEADLRVTLEEAVETARRSTPGGFVTDEVFEMPDVSDREAVYREAARRFDARRARESDMALTYHSMASGLRPSGPGALLSQTRPMPLDEAEARLVLAQLAVHPDYRGQVVVVIARGWKILGLAEGKTVAVPALARRLIEGRPNAASEEIDRASMAVRDMVLEEARRQ